MPSGCIKQACDYIKTADSTQSVKPIQGWGRKGLLISVSQAPCVATEGLKLLHWCNALGCTANLTWRAQETRKEQVANRRERLRPDSALQASMRTRIGVAWSSVFNCL